jgi:hypothetical protein
MSYVQLVLGIHFTSFAYFAGTDRSILHYPDSGISWSHGDPAVVPVNRSEVAAAPVRNIEFGVFPRVFFVRAHRCNPWLIRRVSSAKLS